MSALSHRQRALMALNHEEPDRVPMDLGGAMTAGMNVKAYTRLVDHLGAPDQDGLTQAPATRFQLAAFSESILRRFDVDFRPLYPSMAERSPEVAVGKSSLRDEWGMVRGFT